jgi:hypothetical protein
MWPFTKKQTPAPRAQKPAQTQYAANPSGYGWPPADQEQAEDWSSEHPLDAVAYAAGWSASGEGYGPEQARAEWPEMPGFDFDSGAPDWSEISEESGYEYRTVLSATWNNPATTTDGWELVQSFAVNPEPELYDEEGSPSGVMYIGEENREVVYRREDED